VLEFFFAIASLSSLLQLSVFKLRYLLGVIVGKHQVLPLLMKMGFANI